MPAASATIIPDLLIEHFEELEFLWSQRCQVLTSPVLTRRELLRLEERIAAHLEGLMVGGEACVDVVKGGLTSGESSVAFAAAFTLLNLNLEPATKLVREAFLQAQGSACLGIGQALGHSPSRAALEILRAGYGGESPLVGAVAAQGLAFHQQLEKNPERFERWASDESPLVRAAAWRACALGGFTAKPQSLEAGLKDEDVTVRQAALEAAAWIRYPDLLRLLRGALNEPAANWNALLLFATLAGAEDAPRLMALATRPELGPRRFEILGVLGDPAGVEHLLRGMQSSEPRTAVTAAAAFTRITGHDIESQRRVTLPPEDGHEPDEFEKEFLDEAKLPDMEKAAQYWERNRNQFAAGSRWAKGFNVSQGVSPEVLDQLDLQSRHEVCLRGRFQGKWAGSAIDLEQYPSKALPAVVS